MPIGYGIISEIAENVVLSLADYFGIPFIMPQALYTAAVNTDGGRLNMREKPDFNSEIITSVPNGAVVTVYSDYGEWSLVMYQNYTGYVYNSYLK